MQIETGRKERSDELVSNHVAKKDTTKWNKMVCQQRFVTECHLRQVTVYLSSREEICGDNYYKRCNIVYNVPGLKETVRHCHHPIRKMCNEESEEKEDILDKSKYCETLFETKCSTHFVTVNKKRNVVHTECSRLPLKLCRKVGCRIVEDEEECWEEVAENTFKVPKESCSLIPVKRCRGIYRLVPYLKPTQHCEDVPKEICDFHHKSLIQGGKAYNNLTNTITSSNVIYQSSRKDNKMKSSEENFYKKSQDKDKLKNNVSKKSRKELKQLEVTAFHHKEDVRAIIEDAANDMKISATDYEQNLEFQSRGGRFFFLKGSNIQKKTDYIDQSERLLPPDNKFHYNEDVNIARKIIPRSSLHKKTNFNAIDFFETVKKDPEQSYGVNEKEANVIDFVRATYIGNEKSGKQKDHKSKETCKALIRGTQMKMLKSVEDKSKQFKRSNFKEKRKPKKLLKTFFEQKSMVVNQTKSLSSLLKGKERKSVVRPFQSSDDNNRSSLLPNQTDNSISSLITSNEKWESTVEKMSLKEIDTVTKNLQYDIKENVDNVLTGDEIKEKHSEEDDNLMNSINPVIKFTKENNIAPPPALFTRFSEDIDEETSKTGFSTKENTLLPGKYEKGFFGIQHDNIRESNALGYYTQQQTYGISKANEKQVKGKISQNKTSVEGTSDIVSNDSSENVESIPKKTSNIAPKRGHFRPPSKLLFGFKPITSIFPSTSSTPIALGEFQAPETLDFGFRPMKRKIT